MTRVIVTDAGRGSAIAFIRSLGRRGMEVVAADADPRSPGFRSRYTTRSLVYPSPLEAPEAVVELLVREAARSAVDVIVPVTDEVILPLAAARDRFAGLTTLAIPADDALATAADKRATLELAQALGVPVPVTVAVGTVEEAVAAGDELRFPVVLKPQVSRRYLGSGGTQPFSVAYAASRDGLARAMETFEGRCGVLLQEYVAGAGVGVELLLSSGEPLAAFQHRRLREVPPTGGASSFRESVPLDPVLLDHAVRLLRALAWHGLAMVEFKLGRDGPVLMEINGRVWGSLPLAVKAGVDFPARLVDLLLGAPADVRAEASAPGYRVGVRSRNLQLELVWIASVLLRRTRHPFLPQPERREAVAAAARLLWPGDGYDVLSLRDPGPGLAELGKVARALSRKARRG